MEKFRTALNKALELLAGLSMAVMVILTTYQVIARYIFNSPSTWSEELVGYLFGWSTLFGATIVSGERGHMNIPILVDRMNPGMRKAFHILWEAVAFLFSATILVFGGFQVSKLAMGQQTSSLGVAVGVFYWVMPICGVVILLYSILNIIGIANGNIIPAGTTSPYSLYSENLVTFGESDYDQGQAAGFINLWGLPTKVQALQEQGKL